MPPIGTDGIATPRADASARDDDLRQASTTAEGEGLALPAMSISWVSGIKLDWGDFRGFFDSSGVRTQARSPAKVRDTAPTRADPAHSSASVRVRYRVFCLPSA